jgi:hypothetical protein
MVDPVEKKPKEQKAIDFTKTVTLRAQSRPPCG